MSGVLSKVERAYALVLDKRWEYVPQLIANFNVMDLWHKCRLFIAGDGSNSKLTYDHIDVSGPPMRYSNSTDYPTWWARPNAYNAWLCHKKIFEESYAAGYKYILLMEDDAVVEQDFHEILAKVEPTLEQLDWSMLYFGAYHYQGSSFPTASSNLLKANGCGGFHGVIIRRDVIAEFVHNYNHPIGPWDWVTGRYIHSTYNCYTIYPGIINQRDGIHSYVEDTILHKPPRDAK
jgi:hypothetical protein